MTKTIILSALALLSLTMSYFYEVSTVESSNTNDSSASFTITPYSINSGEDMVRALEFYEPAEEESANSAQAFFSKKLNMRFSSPDYKQLVETATQWIGTPYRYGRSSKRGTDCSGFVTSVYKDVYGIKLKRSSNSMFQEVERIQKDSIRTGDLVFFKRSPKQPVFHVGIYLKNNKFIHSASNGGVKVSSLKEPFYRNYYYAAGRVN
jgi:cell wall-associated NlpC family hydrolase